jgi:hypothetical protein
VVGRTVEAGVLVPVLGDLTRFKEFEDCFWDSFASSFCVSFSTILRALAPLAAMMGESEGAVRS